jgi:hypothetical protein
VFQPTWRSTLGHEVFHAYSYRSLAAVPQFIQEGLADWYGAQLPDGTPESGLERWAGLLSVETRASLRFAIGAPQVTATHEVLLVRRVTPLDMRPSVEQVAQIGNRGLQALDDDQHAFAQCIGFAVVSNIVRTRPHALDARFLGRRNDETTAEYLRRLGIASLAELELQAGTHLRNASPVRVFLRRMRIEVDSLVGRFRKYFASEEEFLASLSANVTYEGRTYDLMQDADFVRLVCLHW